MKDRRTVCKEMAVTLPIPRAIAAPQSLFFAVVSAGGLALLLLIATLNFISNPFGSTNHKYLVGVDHLRKPSLVLFPCENQTRSQFQWQQPSEKGNKGMVMDERASASKMLHDLEFSPVISFDQAQKEGNAISSVSTSGEEEMEAGGTFPSGLIDDSRKNASAIYSDGSLASTNITLGVAPLLSPPSEIVGKDQLKSCNLYKGKWVYDPAGPLYTNNSCPIIVQSWNCQGNGRPDREYENWRWKPDQCDLPRFDSRKFLELMKGKTLAFVGDSLARNQMESMLCILWQVEKPKQLIHPWMHKWYFKSTSTTIARIWSAWLVHTTSEPLPSTPEGLLKIHLDTPDKNFIESLPKFDVVVLSAGHWFYKQSAYLRNGAIVGGQLWHPKRPPKKQIDNAVAYGIAIKTTLSAIATMPNYTGLTVLRTYSPDHLLGEALNTGNLCGRTAKTSSKMARNTRIEVMYNKQIKGFDRAVKKLKNGSKMRLMDITEVFKDRHDGHPGPYYRSFDSNILRKRGSNRKPPSKDCGHWCMPGPVDTWNEILFEIIRREL